MTLSHHSTTTPWIHRAAAVALLGVCAPATAITFGESDGTAHPFVGSMVVSIPGEGVFQWCSGTLIAPQVFLTASHCTAPVASFVANNPGSVFYVTFDPVIDTTGLIGTFYTGTPHTNPLYASGGNNDPYDVAVITLDLAPPITPAELPTAGLLDAMKADHLLPTARFTAVGYGTTRESMQKGWQGILDNVERQHADQGFFSLTAAWASFDMLPTGANDSGGTCYGDSGGPHFVHQDGVETDIVAAITITGDAQCKALDKDYRVDTPNARAFLGQFVTLP
ncbi:MAG TPA: trypsin-like serine protease [Rudaea sp.]|nr:trypsin-like serine protease [Rudaea sp.]